MDAFRFSPELFEVRTEVLAALNNAGFEWLSHFSAVDPLHDLYGIEVCGIVRHEDAKEIQQLLQKLFPNWRVGCLWFRDCGREPGYVANVHRDDPPEDEEQWETT